MKTLDHVKFTLLGELKHWLANQLLPSAEYSAMLNAVPVDRSS